MKLAPAVRLFFKVKFGFQEKYESSEMMDTVFDVLALVVE